MKIITVMQPWATLIARGIKTIETRPAPPNGDMRPDGVRGLPGLAINRGERIAIHAAATVPRDPFGVLQWSPLPLGAVVATALVADALEVRLEADRREIPPNGCLKVTRQDHPHPGLHRIEWKRNAWTGAPTAYIEIATDGIAPTTHGQLPLGDFRPGRWGWLLTDVRQLPEPIPATGKQGVWEWTPSHPCDDWDTSYTGGVCDSCGVRPTTEEAHRG